MQGLRINTEQVIEYVKEQLTDLLHDKVISPSMYNKKKNFRLIMRAINQADRDICLYEKHEDVVSILVKADRTTVFFADQAESIADYFDQFSDLKTSDVRQYARMISDKSYLDVISVAEAKAYVFDDIPLAGEKTTKTIEHGTLNDIYSAHSRAQEEDFEEGQHDVRYKTYFEVFPSDRKMLLSQPFSTDKWLKFRAKIAPQELDVLGMQQSELECYEIITPYYAKAWLTIKVLNELLPLSAAVEAGIADSEAVAQRRTRGLKPGSGHVVISGDEIDSPHRDEFNDL